MKEKIHDFYRFSAKSLHGEDIMMSTFKGKTVLVVNTASNCGFTPQFAGLEKLYQKYCDKGFVILGFPCNQFANQEPGDEHAIANVCFINYGVTFPMFAKIDVNGPNAHPLYNYLKKRLGGFFGGSIKWNFTKFLINADGNPIKRFAPAVTPDKIDLYLSKIIK